MLIRKIASIGKWSRANISGFSRKDALFGGDAISDLHTKGHTLSVWMTPDDMSEMDSIATALALTRDKLSKMVLVGIEESELQRLEIKYKQINATDNPVTDPAILNLHHDIVEIDYWHLGFVAEIIQKIVEKDSDCRGMVIEYSKEKIKKLLLDALNNGRVDISKIKKDLKSQLGLPVDN